MENAKCTSSQSGLFAKTESRNQPGGCNITHLMSANGDQGTFINSTVKGAPSNVSPQNNQHLYIRYTAPTFSSDVIGRQGAPFVQPEDSSYNSQFKFFSVDPQVKARPLSIYKRSQRNCPNAKGASNIMMHNGQFMRVFDNAPQSAPVNPFDTVRTIILMTPIEKFQKNAEQIGVFRWLGCFLNKNGKHREKMQTFGFKSSCVSSHLKIISLHIHLIWSDLKPQLRHLNMIRMYFFSGNKILQEKIWRKSV